MHENKLPGLSFVALSLLAACASGGNRYDMSAIDTLLGKVEQVRAEAERSRGAITTALAPLEALAQGRFGDDTAADVFARFVESIEAADQQARQLRESITPMQEAAAPMFESWQADIAAIANERLKQLGEVRLTATRKRYEAVQGAVVPAQERFDAYLSELRDHATFLSHDFNASALTDVRGEVQRVAQVAKQLDRDLAVAVVAARAYVDGSAPPAASPPAGR